MKIQSSSIRVKVLSAALSAALCITPDMWAQQPAGAQPQTAQPSQTTQQQNPPATQPAPAGQQGQQPGGTTVNPSQPPLAPAPVTTYPGGQPPEQAPAQTTSVPEAPQPKQPPQQPLGAATAEKVPTAGQAAAKPAGAAIAPAQQHQTRSLLIKLGAVAAAGVAIGTVFALSKGSPSKPPGAP